MESNLARADFRLLAICFTILVFLNGCNTFGILISCEREQTSLINQETILDCTITAEYYGVYWYNGESKDSIVRYINGQKAGPGYHSGKFDIAPNGSLIIKNVSVNDEGTYRVMVVLSAGGDISAYANLTVIVPSSRHIPEIDLCNNDESCRLCIDRPTFLKCSMDGRPAVGLKWFNISSEIPSENKLVTESFSTPTLISTSVVNVDPDSRDIKEIVCVPSGPAVTLHENAAKNASVLLITPSDPNARPMETYYLSGTNSLKVIGKYTSNTVAWIKQTANVDFSLETPNCKTLDWSENGKLALQLNKDFEGIYTQVVRKEGNTFERNVYKVRQAKGPEQSHFIEDCLSQDPQKCSKYVDGTGTLTCSVNDTRPAGSITWNVTQSGLSVNVVSLFDACEDGLCNTSATIAFQLTSAQVAVGELECIVNGPWNGFPHSSIVQVYNNRTQIRTATTPSTGESEKARTIGTIPLLVALIIVTVILVVFILHKYRNSLCKILKPSKRERIEYQNNTYMSKQY